ncbi:MULTISPECIES: hypothetical protein [unclassified Curtobacterium]|uniref:hypothetical protein n=1 Tax=unclassified Curtobacterium TaxID=257496 RepID=UPI0008DC8E64|nr:MULTISPECIES: hypothetical protein [unclassified Curtobacterium]OIH96881.1 hypothetical protein BIU92_04010 [Curtobacterium sp. MCBA15_003]OII09379.1 hypothetical protein BIU97_12740 [Curtobacterium sp. MCBA15_009]OII31069.1 hypothetical protein BIU94_05205 [Curtobacterium sp. MMLR14_006]
MANIVSQIADKVRPTGVSTNYGDPVEVGDQTIIPVSLGWFGFGGGGDDENGGGGGGGGGGASVPVGAYVRRPGQDLEFEPNLISLVAVSIPLVWVAGKALSKVIRALKK